MIEIRAKSGAGLRLLAGLGQVLERGRLSVPQIRRVLGHQQRRSPGAHLPLHHGRGRRQHVGLRRDDQQLQRHPQLQDHDHHGRQSRGGASGIAAACAARQGAQPREHHRARSALHAHRRSRHGIRAHPLQARTSPSSGACCGTSSRTAGRTRNTSASASAAWTTSARKSRSGRPRKSSASPASRKRSSSVSPRPSPSKSPPA